MQINQQYSILRQSIQYCRWSHVTEHSYRQQLSGEIAGAAYATKKKTKNRYQADINKHNNTKSL